MIEVRNGERGERAQSVGSDYVTNRLLARNRIAVRRRSELAKFPRMRLAIVTCMDCRIDVYEALGLTSGDANVLRNAGGIVTDDVIRSLVLSQRLLGTREVILMHHTDCGLHDLDEERFVDDLAAASGARPPFEFGAFRDVDDDVRRSLARVIDSPFVAEKGSVRGFVYDVATAQVREVRP